MSADSVSMLQNFYVRRLQSPDLIERSVAEHQLRRLAPTRRPTRPDILASWGDALIGLFEGAGNSVRLTGPDQGESGHAPFHSSKSGTCVSINRARGLWWCSSCRRGGTAVSLVRALRGCTAQAAEVWLASTYGPPATPVSIRRMTRRGGIRVTKL